MPKFEIETACTATLQEFWECEAESVEKARAIMEKPIGEWPPEVEFIEQESGNEHDRRIVNIKELKR